MRFGARTCSEGELPLAFPAARPHDLCPDERSVHRPCRLLLCSCWRREFLSIVRQRSAMTIWHVDEAGCGRGSERVAESEWLARVKMVGGMPMPWWTVERSQDRCSARRSWRGGAIA